MHFSTGSAFLRRSLRPDPGAARLGRRPQAPGARPRSLALALALWPVRRALEAGKILSVSRGRSGARPASRRTVVCPIHLKKRFSAPKKKHPAARPHDIRRPPHPSNLTRDMRSAERTKNNRSSRAQLHCCCGSPFRTQLHCFAST